MDRALELGWITSRLTRSPQDTSDDIDWSDFTPEERMEAVWTLTKACLAWGESDVNELRLNRAVTRIQRGKR